MANKQNYSNEDYRKARRNLTVIIIALVVLWALLTLTGCTTTKIVEVEKVRTDTTHITKQQRDSIWLHDSLYIREYQRGDTVYLERTKWLTKYIERTKTDTLYRSKTDTVYVSKTIEKQTPKNWWDSWRIYLGNICLVALGILLLIRFIRLKR